MRCTRSTALTRKGRLFKLVHPVIHNRMLAEQHHQISPWQGMSLHCQLMSLSGTCSAGRHCMPAKGRQSWVYCDLLACFRVSTIGCSYLEIGTEFTQDRASSLTDPATFRRMYAVAEFWTTRNSCEAWLSCPKTCGAIICMTRIWMSRSCCSTIRIRFLKK